MYCFSLRTGVHLGHCILFCYALGSPPPPPPPQLDMADDVVGYAAKSAELFSPFRTVFFHSMLHKSLQNLIVLRHFMVVEPVASNFSPHTSKKELMIALSNQATMIVH